MAILALGPMTLPASGDEPPTLAFGPKQYNRLAGRPQTFTETFQHCGTAPCQIVVVNGNPDGTKRVSSASISLNGVQVVAPSDFNQQAARIVKPVVLTDQNQLTVKLSSGAGSFLVVSVECAASPAILSIGTPGASLQDPTTLLSAIPILNTGTVAAQSVMVTTITLTGGTLASPASLPFNLGSIPASGSTVLNANFSGGPFAPGGTYALTVEGIYAVGPATYCFTLNSALIIPSAAPGSEIAGTVRAQVQRTAGGPFPPKPAAEQEEANPPGPPIPIGPPSHIFFDTTDLTAVLDFSHLTTFPGPMPGEVAGANVAFVKNVTNSGAGFPPDPSAASSGGVVMVSHNNTTVKISIDGGNTFTTYNATTLYADNPDGGLCCDQVIHYVPSINRFVWMIQTSRDANGASRERLAVASPEAIASNFYTAWSFWDLTSALFGFGNAFLDYPELAVGDTFLYMSVDRVGTGLFVARIPLTQLRDAVNADVQFTDPKNGLLAFGSHICQNVGDTAFWAGHTSTSQMRIFRWAENSSQYSWRDVNVNSWANQDYTSQAPDGQYWLPAPLGYTPQGGSVVAGVIGATRKIVSSIVPPGGTPPPNEVWFAWTAARNTAGGRPHPYVEVVRFNDQNSDALGQFQVWNRDHAFAVPALNADPSSGDVAISLAWGGGGRYFANNAVGFLGDFLLYSTSASDVTLTGIPGPGCGDASGGATPNRCTRYGDYFSVRRVGTSPCIFSTLGYATKLANPAASTDCLVFPGCGTVVNYVEFGRDGCIFPPAPPR